MNRHENRNTTIIDTTVSSRPRLHRQEKPSPDHDFFGSRVNPIPKFLARPMPFSEEDAPDDRGHTVRVRFFDVNRGFGYVVSNDSGVEAFLSADILKRDQIDPPAAGQSLRVFIASGVKGLIVSGVDRKATARLNSQDEPSAFRMSR